MSCLVARKREWNLKRNFSIWEARLQHNVNNIIMYKRSVSELFSDTSRDLGIVICPEYMRRTLYGKVHGYSKFLFPRNDIGQVFWPRVVLEFVFSYD